MQPKRFVVLAVVLLFALCLSDAFAFTVEYNKGYSLSESVENCDIVVVGRVTAIDYVWRDNIETKHTTDVTVTIDNLIKGTPNQSGNKVKFTVEGGHCVDPETGERYWRHVSHVPTFEVGEKIMLFLRKNEDRYYENYPYQRLQPYRNEYGKAKVVGNKVGRLYLLGDTDPKDVKGVSIPLELATNLCKASVKDKDEADKLDDAIKSELKSQSDDVSSLPQSLINTLNRKANEIIRQNTEQREK